ncbi:MAG TPA: hypothetical protein VEY89_05225 [Candidatus Dormibacteraeota bacterium]|nr:hypothetical protein [Candidatus Dormibacteraeota bacterium]
MLLLCCGRQLWPFVTGHRPDEPLVYVVPLPAAPLPGAPQDALHAHPSAAGAISLPGPAAPSPAALTPREQAHIDWELEAEVAADEWIGELARHERRKCDDSDKPGSWLPKCKKKRSSFEWNAEPQRAGFESGLP